MQYELLKEKKPWTLACQLTSNSGKLLGKGHLANLSEWGRAACSLYNNGIQARKSATAKTAVATVCATALKASG